LREWGREIERAREGKGMEGEGKGGEEKGRGGEWNL